MWNETEIKPKQHWKNTPKTTNRRKFAVWDGHQPEEHVEEVVQKKHEGHSNKTWEGFIWRGTRRRTWLQTDHIGDKLLSNVLCSTGGTKYLRSTTVAPRLFWEHVSGAWAKWAENRVSGSGAKSGCHKNRPLTLRSHAIYIFSKDVKQQKTKRAHVNMAPVDIRGHRRNIVT